MTRNARNPHPHIRQGNVYWLQNCQPLDDDNEKDHPVVLVDDPKTIAAGGPVIVAVCSTKNRASDPDGIKLPDRSTQPQTKSGLKKPCWAIPRWHFAVERDRLDEYIGYLTGGVLHRVLRAYEARALPRSPDRTEASPNQ